MGVLSRTYWFSMKRPGELTEGKVLSTPDDPSRGVVTGIEQTCEKVGISFSDLNLLFHGTTVVTNMILTNTGSRVGLLTTKGHEQILHLARAWTPGPLYGWMALVKPDPPAALTDTVGILERTGADGGIITELDEDQAREAIKSLAERGVEALADRIFELLRQPGARAAGTGDLPRDIPGTIRLDLLGYRAGVR